MAISTEYLEQMAIALEAMNPKFHASTDNLGKYLGDGIPRAGKISLRTVPLSEALRELIERRETEIPQRNEEIVMPSTWRWWLVLVYKLHDLIHSKEKEND